MTFIKRLFSMRERTISGRSHLSAVYVAKEINVIADKESQLNRVDTELANVLYFTFQ